MSDKDIEKNRYENRAKLLLDNNKLYYENKLPKYLNAPYLEYEKAHIKHIYKRDKVLEIGAGIGTYTHSLLKTGAFVVATDISPSSLKIIKKKYKEYSAKLSIKVADIELLPFEDKTFDVVCSAGSLSYGDNQVVMNEIYRVLKPGGRVIIVDSLHQNPIYIVNRWIGYFRGQRSLNTIKRMPSLKLIKRYRIKFNLIDLYFFGSIVWLIPILRIFLKTKMISKFIDRFDTLINTKYSAFKFVVVFNKK